MTKSIVLGCTFVLALPLSILAQEEDHSSIDQIVSALYDVISGPAGERDWDRFSSLFHASAIMGALQPGQQGGTMYAAFTPDQYQKNNAQFFAKSGFWEEEIGRQVHRYGELAQVFSAYQFRVGDKTAPVTMRGINSIQMVYKDGRWWITSLQWNPERTDNPIPAEYLSE